MTDIFDTLAVFVDGMREIDVHPMVIEIDRAAGMRLLQAVDGSPATQCFRVPFRPIDANHGRVEIELMGIKFRWLA